MNLDTKTLDDVEFLLNTFVITKEQAQAHLDKWNATPGRFTHAAIAGDRILNMRKWE
jgi:hypothetical protein